MGKRVLFLSAAVMFFIAVNMHPACTVAVNGQYSDMVYSPSTVFQAEMAAGTVLDEINSGETRMPQLEKQYRLCVRLPEGDVKTLSHRIIISSGQVILLHRIAIDGEILGYVESGAVLKERLHRYAYTHMPPGAESCRLSCKLTTQPVYCHSGQKWGYEEMLNRILDASPLIYTADA